MDRQFKFHDKEKRVFRKVLRNVADFSGVKVLTYCAMSSHFHVLTLVPEREEISDRELVRRLGRLYQPVLVKQIEAELKEAREEAKRTGNDKLYKRMRERYLHRMYDVSEFMKTLKQRFSVWYNRNNSRVGTLWEERFRSVLVEGSEDALLTIAAYIDLNPVRAGMVKDPKDYAYCGYGEAVGSHKPGLAREGLGLVMQSLGQAEVPAFAREGFRLRQGAPARQVGAATCRPASAEKLRRGETEASWGQVSHMYRWMLYEKGEKIVDERGQVKRQGFEHKEIQKVLDAGGHLALTDALRCKVRYFTDGLAFGKEEYLEKVFQKHRKGFSATRKTGARKMRHADWKGLCTLRDLRTRAVTAS